MREVKTEIEIQATPERVWSILVNFPAHSKWNPFVGSQRKKDQRPMLGFCANLLKPNGREARW
jgi:hypothetical protein